MHCYVAGRLVGAWYDCTDIADDPANFDVERIHRDGGYPATPECEELWCFDIEYIPHGQEIDLAAAARWGECYQELEAPHLWPALCAWVATEMYTEDNWGMPSVSSFTDEHQGHWGSWLDFAYPIIDETVDMSGWDELAKKYFNYESYARTLKYDYSVK